MNYSRFLQLIGGLVLLSFISVSALADDFDDSVGKLTLKPGFFNLYGDPQKSALLLEITELNQPFIYVTSLPQGLGSNDIGLDRGQIGESRLVQFERFGRKIVLRQLNPYYRAISDNVSEKLAVNQAFAESIITSFELVAQRDNKLLIDVSSWLIQDVHGVAATLKGADAGNYQINTQTSVVDWSQSKSFVDNTELSAVVTLNGESKGRHISSVTPDSRYVSLRFRHSLVRLPDENYHSRKFDPYSGYFPFEYLDYAQPIAKPLAQKFIYRHRLTKNGQGQVEQPITYYLDPGVPEPVRGALLDGARWWTDAFERAGFKGGYKVEMLPEGADPLDVRYNVIQWVHRSTRGWSYGSSVADPRTGEILKGHVSLGSLRVKQDYLIAMGLLGGIDKAVAQQQAQEMALARIRQLAAHEVGHTLGVAHNFAASVKERASVMDYPHPLIELTNGKIDISNAYGVGLGAWDNYVINYGYGEFSDPSQLSQLISQTKAQGFKFISDSDARAAGGSNPWAHLWDNGAKADQELVRLIKVRQQALNNFNSSILDPSLAHSELREMLAPIYLLHRYQVQAASKIIAGVDFNYGLSGQPLSHHVVDSQWQRQALAALLQTLTVDFLTLPQDIISQLPPKAYGFYANRESFSSSLGHNFDPLAIAEASARHSLKYLLNSHRLNRLTQQLSMDSEQLSVGEVISSVIDGSLKAFSAQRAKRLDGLVAKRVEYVVIEQLLKAYHSVSIAPETRSELAVEINKLTKWLVRQGKKGPKSLRSHYRVLAQGLEKGLEDDQYKIIRSPAKLPPGSPI